MKEPHGKGVASHPGPESCGVTREGGAEALTGESAGQPLSRDNQLPRRADVFGLTEGNRGGHVKRVPTAPRGRRPWHARKLFFRKLGDLLLDRPEYRAARIGKAGWP